MNRVPFPLTLTRRDFTLGALVSLAACAGSEDKTSDEGSDVSDGSEDTDGSDSEGSDTEGTSAGGWATGGTASMSGTYPDPFGELPGTCALTCAMTLGPCYGDTLERKDISEGVDGLPVRMAFRVVNDACEPIEGAAVDIWHTAPNGIYSGEDVSNFCTSGDTDAEAGKWFRGVQITDQDGRCDFDSCFPGWYSGRAIHIHLTVRIGTDKYVTSQLFFPQPLINEIFANEPVYKTFGKPDTPNASDGIANSVTLSEYVFDCSQMEDGAMMASKTLILRSSLSDKAC